MIIQIRGTSGSGKTYVMRKVIEAIRSLDSWDKVYLEGRKKPLNYSTTFRGKRVAVLGHYESACGGCDNIGSAKAVFDLIGETEADSILCEGLLLSEDTKWSSQLSDLKVVFLSTPLEDCLKQIAQRREAAGNDKELNPLNTSKRVAVIDRARVKLKETGAEVVTATASEAITTILNWLGCTRAEGDQKWIRSNRG